MIEVVVIAIRSLLDFHLKAVREYQEVNPKICHNNI
jgi:hypothetical protein